MSAFQVGDVVSLAENHNFRGVVTQVVTGGKEWFAMVRQHGYSHTQVHSFGRLRLYSRHAPNIEPRIPVIIPEPITVPGQFAVTVKLTSKGTELSFSPIGGDS